MIQRSPAVLFFTGWLFVEGALVYSVFFQPLPTSFVEVRGRVAAVTRCGRYKSRISIAGDSREFITCTRRYPPGAFDGLLAAGDEVTVTVDAAEVRDRKVTILGLAAGSNRLIWRADMVGYQRTGKELGRWLVPLFTVLPLITVLYEIRLARTQSLDLPDEVGDERHEGG